MGDRKTKGSNMTNAISRRNFLKGSVATAAVASLAACGSSSDALRWRYATLSVSSTPPYIESSTFV